MNILFSGNKLEVSFLGKDYSFPYSAETLDKLRALTSLPILEAKAALEELVASLQSSLQQQDYEVIASYLVKDNKTAAYHLIFNGTVITKYRIPDVFVQLMKNNISEGVTNDPIVKFLIRLTRNPLIIKGVKDYYKWGNMLGKYITTTTVDNSLFEEYKVAGFADHIARAKATKFQTPITEGGALATYKVVELVMNKLKYEYVRDEEGNISFRKTKNYLDRTVVNPETGDEEFVEEYMAEEIPCRPCVYPNGQPWTTYMNGQVITEHKYYFIGAIHELPSWEYVDCNDSHTCVPGFHLGNIDYVHGYTGNNKIVMCCFVAPEDIGAVAASEDVLRVYRYYPYQFQKLGKDGRIYANRSTYYASTLLDHNDAEWARYKQQLIDEEIERQRKAIQDLSDKLL